MELPVERTPPGEFISIIHTYRFVALFLGLSIFSLFIALLLVVRTIQNTSPMTMGSFEEKKEGGSYTVHITGGVENPGVYSVPSSSRVEDVIVKAGGLSKNANTKIIETEMNLAAKIKDGMKLYIPVNNAQGDDSGALSNTSHNKRFTTSGEVSNDNEPKTDPLDTNDSLPQISINAASIDDLDSLPGVGPVISQKIIDGRPYNSLEELVSKKILGQKTFEKLRAFLTL